MCFGVVRLNLGNPIYRRDKCVMNVVYNRQQI